MAVDLWALLPILVGVITISLTIFRIFIIKPLEKINDKIDKINENREQRSDEVNERFAEVVDKINDQDRFFVKALQDIYNQLTKIAKP